jgi:hypothetical protein
MAMRMEKIDCTWFWSFMHLQRKEDKKGKREREKEKEEASRIRNDVLAFFYHDYLRPRERDRENKGKD